jgi:carboxylesterase type B
MMWVTNEHFGKEDCLSLHVFTPNAKGNLPVMVYFHGGGFSLGTANTFGAEYLMDEDVVFVMVNYRLGPFGFLSTLDEVLPGNYGLKDQSLSLKWVQENIRKFGGNPSSVTIIGNSAGGASVNYQMMSPLSSGLFHAAIAQSGSSLNPWARSTNPKEMAKRFGKILNCSFQTSQIYKDCLMKKSTKEILNAMEYLVQWGYDPFTPFGPVIEPNLPGAFLTEEPEVLMETGRFNQVPVLTGIDEDEGILMHASFILNDPQLLKEFNNEFERVYPITLELDEVYTNLSSSAQIEMSRKIREYYFKNKIITEDDPETTQQLINVFSDRFFNHHVKKAAILMAKHVPVYLYIFAHNRGDYVVNKFFGIDKNYGVSHGDEVSFLFADSFNLAPDFVKGSVAEQVSKDFVKLWVSFAKDKSPTAVWGSQDQWTPVSDAQIEGMQPVRYYRIDAETSFIQEPFTERIEFWEQLFRQAYESAGSRDEL